MELLERSMKECSEVTQEWRKAELLSLIMKGSRDLQPDLGKYMEENVMRQLKEMQSGSGLSDALKGTAPHFDRKYCHALIEIALSNRGFEKKDMKSVIKRMISFDDWEMCHRTVIERMKGHDDKLLSLSVLGYLHHQTRKNHGARSNSNALRISLDILKDLEDDEALENFSNLCLNNLLAEDLSILEEFLERSEDRDFRIKVLADLATAADKAGSREAAVEYIDRAEKLLEDMEGNARTIRLCISVASARSRLDQPEEADKLFDKAVKMSGGDPNLMKMISERKVRVGPKVNVSGTERISDLPVNGTRHILALYDTYEGGLKQTHVRAVSRAAPLCAAFSLDLALMGFPTDDIERIIDLSSSETNIGKGGKFLNEMHRQGRIHLVPCKENEPPRDWSELGLPVATTSHPSEAKKVDMKRAVDLAVKEHERKRICLIMGIGRKGLPRTLLDSVPYHLEITGLNIPLETATAMGILTYILWEGKSR